jgi:hypothetical protein
MFPYCNSLPLATSVALHSTLLTEQFNNMSLKVVSDGPNLLCRSFRHPATSLR